MQWKGLGIGTIYDEEGLSIRYMLFEMFQT